MAPERLDRWIEGLAAALQTQEPALATAQLVGIMHRDAPEIPALTVGLVLTLTASAYQDMFAAGSREAAQAQDLWRIAALVAADVLLIETAGAAAAAARPARLRDLLALWNGGEGATPRPGQG
jgi:hypothetical protein